MRSLQRLDEFLAWERDIDRNGVPGCGASCETIWELTLPIAPVRELTAILEHNVSNPIAPRANSKPSRITSGNRGYLLRSASFHTLPRVLPLCDLKDRSVIELVPRTVFIGAS